MGKQTRQLEEPVDVSEEVADKARVLLGDGRAFEVQVSRLET